MKPSFLFLLLIAFTAQAQTPSTGITIGHVDTLYSNILGETRKLWVYVPKQAEVGRYTLERFPVVYLLDGEDHFDYVRAILREMSEGSDLIPPMILVGIVNADRNRDFSPTYSTSAWYGDAPRRYRTTGGAENFTHFLKEELIPSIESRYPVAPYRMLIGHSLSGLYTIHALLHHTELFEAYLAIDPGLRWDNQWMIQQAKKVFTSKSFQDKKLYLTVANTYKMPMDSLLISQDTNRASEFIRANFHFASLLQSSTPQALNFQTRYHESDSHASVPLISIYEGLRFIFDYYHFPAQWGLYLDPDYQPDSALIAHFNHVSEKIHYLALPPESRVDRLASGFMTIDQPQKALACFRLNIRNYPTSAHAHERLGDFYAAMGDKAKAKEYYTKALSIKSLPDTRKKLDRLMAEK
ncbi:alpha/beta hydrolase-fold protein [Nibrella viscosa]|uniref:Alpha/beta hydrolase-fold protein n=1 Tax=Nibrella viscosa TaxID=1084524 RepID=A0ABP8K6W6_9BACT